MVAIRITLAFLAIVALGLGILFRNADYDERAKKLTRPRSKTAFTCFVFLITATVLAFSIEIIPTGCTGVRTFFGQIDPKTAQSGLNWKIPIVQSIEKVNPKQQDVRFDEQVWSETNQRTAIYYEKITVTYRINCEKSAWIYANVTDYKNSLVSDGVVQSAIKASSKQLTDVDATNRSIIEPLCEEYLQKTLDDKYGEDVVIVNKIVIGNADFDPAYNNSILAKQQAQIDAEKQAIENEREIKKAEANASVIKTEANARAEAQIIEAKAQAEANSIIQKSMSDEVVTKLWLEKWDGKMPYYITSESSDNLIGIGIPGAAAATPNE